MPSFQDIPQFIDIRNNYEIDIFWRHLQRFLKRDDEEKVINPDFQRGHVWTLEQQSAYIEYRLRGGNCANSIIFACEGFHDHRIESPWYLVDGLQRVTAVLDFLANKVPVFGYTYSEYDGTMRDTMHRFKVRVIDVDRKGMLELYLNLNAGGTPHTAHEIKRVRKLLASS